MVTESTTEAADESFLDKAWVTVKSKGLKYSMVSVFNVFFGQGLLFVLTHLHAADGGPLMPAWVANMIAVCVSAVPAYYMSRAWVWGKRGKSELRREVLPFWIFVAIGLVLSTVTVAVASAWFPPPPDAHFPNLALLIPNIANIVAFGILWVIRFFWMDSAFHLDHHELGPLDVLLDPNEPV